MKGPDHRASSTPNELKEIIKNKINFYHAWFKGKSFKM